jgi:hypothetical protein
VANAARNAALTNANGTQRTFMAADHEVLGLRTPFAVRTFW